MLVDEVRRIASGQLSAHRTTGHPHDSGAKFLFFFTIFFVDFEFDVDADLRLPSATVDFALPSGLMKEDILTKILGINEPEVTFRTHVFYFAKATSLNTKSFWLFFVFGFQGTIVART